ncbi:MAG: hypothetical protein ACR2IH_09475 [Pyrinomonadaceae bacterium]
MANQYAMDDLLDFLSHIGDKGLVPVATAQALAVATRNVFGALEEDEQKNIGGLNLDAIIKRFNNKRARDFSPASLKEYGRRVRRAIELYEQWKDNPANFSVETRAPRKSKKESVHFPADTSNNGPNEVQHAPNRVGTFQSSFPVGSGRVITLSNIPEDLTSSEAERLAQFVRMLSVD